jgi:hypothetical protein
MLEIVSPVAIPQKFNPAYFALQTSIKRYYKLFLLI